MSNRNLSQDSLYSAAEVATESRQQLFPETQLSQPGDDVWRSPAVNNTPLPNTAPLPTGNLCDANQNFGINPSVLNKSAFDQSPRRTISM